MGMEEAWNLKGQPLLSNLQTLVERLEAQPRPGKGDLCGAEMSNSARGVVRLDPSPFEEVGEGVSSTKLRRPVISPPLLPG